MRHKILDCSLFVCFFALFPMLWVCPQNTNFSITGEIIGLKNGFLSITYKDSINQNKKEIVQVAESLFFYEGFIDEPTLAAFNYLNETMFFFIEPNKKMRFFANRDSFNKAILLGSNTNDEMLIRNDLHFKNRNQNKIPKVIRNPPKTTFQIDTGFINSHPNSYYSLYLLNFYFSDLKYEYAKDKFDKFDTKIRNTNLGLKVQERLSLRRKSLPGTILQNFYITTDRRENISFKNIVSSNKLVLIDFWATWCLPCKQNIPFLKSLFSKYGTKGLAILSFSIDQDERYWINTIKKDSLTLWYNTIDDKKKSVQDLFGVDFIPAFFLVNTNLEIIGRYSGRDKGNEDLKKKIEEILGQ